MIRRLTAMILFACTLLVGCQAAPLPTADPPLVVYATSAPLAHFAERIAGGSDAATVKFPVPATEDAEFWQPDDATIREYQSADLVLLQGLGYAKWTATAPLPLATQVDTSLGFKDKWITRENGLRHTHGPAGEHTHSAQANYTWLDPILAYKHAEAIAAAMTKLRPNLEKRFKTNASKLGMDFQAIDGEVDACLQPFTRQPLIASHPVFEYFAKRYKLDMKSLHWEYDRAPSANDLAELKSLLSGHPAKYVFWEHAPKPEAVSALKELGITSIVFDTCSMPEQANNFLTTMRSNAANLRAASKAMPR